MDIVINNRYGGYGVSDKAVELYLQKKNIPVIVNYSRSSKYHKYFIVGDNYTFDGWYIKRHDPVFVEVVKELGKASWGRSAELKIVTIPDGASYSIDEYDGKESYDIWVEATLEELKQGLSEDKLKLAKQCGAVRIAE
jgi:hypothetical protein